jgi:hypothetical protein
LAVKFTNRSLLLIEVQPSPTLFSNDQTVFCGGLLDFLS